MIFALELAAWHQGERAIAYDYQKRVHLGEWHRVKEQAEAKFHHDASVLLMDIAAAMVVPEVSHKCEACDSPTNGNEYCDDCERRCSEGGHL